MTLTEVIYKPRFSIEFSFAEVDELFQASRSHYDHKCRTLSAEAANSPSGYIYTQHGYAFLTGLKNMTMNGFEERPGIVKATNVRFEVLDTLCKIAESPLVSGKTRTALWDLLKRYNAEFDHVNNSDHGA